MAKVEEGDWIMFQKGDGTYIDLVLSVLFHHHVKATYAYTPHHGAVDLSCVIFVRKKP
jgi:hypothetical protein